MICIEASDRNRTGTAAQRGLGAEEPGLGFGSGTSDGGWNAKAPPRPLFGGLVAPVSLVAAPNSFLARLSWRLLLVTGGGHRSMPTRHRGSLWELPSELPISGFSQFHRRLPAARAVPPLPSPWSPAQARLFGTNPSPFSPKRPRALPQRRARGWSGAQDVVARWNGRSTTSCRRCEM